jgi:hypothetical protein
MTKKILVIAFLITASFGLRAQSPTPTPEQSSPPATTEPSKPDATKAKPADSAIVPHRSTVGDPTLLAPLNMKGKFRYFAVESFRPGIYPVAAFYDALTMASPPSAYPPEWRQGFPAFARNYGDFMASWVSVQGGKFIAASLLHEDPRYYPARSKNIFARGFNAVRYAVIDRGDSGRPRLAVANLAGALAGGFVGNAYLPDPYANEAHGLKRSGFALIGFATSNLADEFWPEVVKAAKKLHVPFIK